METSDLVNDTFRRIIPALERFEPQSEGAFQLFIRRALMNRIADVWRATRRRPQEELGDAHADTGPSPLERAVGREALEGYERALSVLDAEHQQAIVLRFEMGLGFSEIAEALGKPSPDAARMTVSRGVKRLIQEMGGAGF